MNVPRNTTFLAFWLMLMKPPAPASAVPNRLTLTLPSASTCARPRNGDVQPAAVVEVELGRLVDHRLRVARGAEVEAAGRHAADDARLGGQRQQVDDALLGGDVGDAFGHADAEVDDAVAPQLDRGAARDDLALLQRQRRRRAERHADLAAEGRAVGVA